MAVWVLVLSSAAFNERARAQLFEAQLTGTIQDASGGVVPDARVQITNVATGVTYTAASNETGVYRFAAVTPAQYHITCIKTGFKRFEQSTITLQVDQVLQLNIALETGQVSDSVVVSAEPPPLETASSSLSQVVTTRSIESLPLNVRDPFALVALTPGVQLGTNFGNGGNKDIGRNFFKSDFYVGGSRSGSQEILIDGAPNTTVDANKGIIDPPVDSMQEFSVQATSFNAQFGRTSGAVINMVTKSGGNSFHGLAYDFERHSVLDANSFFSNLAGQPLLTFQRHQFGGNVGGPVLKNKWFFFGDYEGLRQGYPITFTDTVPTPLQRQGDFSKTFAENGAVIQIYDPTTLQTLADGSRQRSPFPGNGIPLTRFDPVSAATVKLYPLANTAGNAITNQNNYTYSTTSFFNSDKYDVRSDFDVAGGTHMFARVSHQMDARFTAGSLPAPIGGGVTINDTYTHIVADATHVFSPSLVADLNLSFGRALAFQKGASFGFDLAGLGFAPGFAKSVSPQFPVFTISDVTGTNSTGAIVQSQPRNIYSMLGSVSLQRSTHSLKFGGDLRFLHFNENANSIPSGSFSFARGFTQGPNPSQASATAGFGLASFFLGNAASGSVTAITPFSTEGLYYAFYAQDDWKVTRRLTLNIGLRWDVTIGNREKYDRLAYFDPNATSPIASAAGLPNLRGTLVWIGQRNPSYTQATDWHDFGPRFGFAYSLDKNTVIRGGYGIFYLPHAVQGNGGGAIEAQQTTTLVSSIDGLTPANNLNNPFPQGVVPPANDRNPLANIGTALTAPEHEFRSGYSQTWSFNVQRGLPGGVVVDAHYWGMKGTRLFADAGNTNASVTFGFNINQLPDQYLALGTHLNDLVPNPFYHVITTGALSGTTISRQQSLLPFPQYTSISQVFQPSGASNYHAGTIQAEKRLSSVLTFLGSYTRSKALDDLKSPLTIYKRSLDRSLSSFDVPNQLRLSFVYFLPFGKDRAHGKHMNPFFDALVGGWDFDGIINLQSGYPISISRSAVNNGHSAKLDNPSLAAWFNTSVFTNTPAFTYGNVGPYLPDVRTDWVRNIDTVLVKKFGFAVAEHNVTAQFRFEVYNLFNTPQFGAPGGTIGSQTFGVVSTLANAPRDIQIGLKLAF
jgi:hypothetical protein